MKIDCVIGIDPGASGGIAVWKPNGYLKCVKMPKSLDELKMFLEQYKQDFRPIVIIEKLSVRADDVSVTDGKANMGKMYRIQTLMQNFEQLKAIVHFLDIPYVLVHPMKWQNDLKLRIKSQRRKEETPERKRRYKEISGRLYPEYIQTLWSADATLIMHFGRLMLQNNQKWIFENLPQRMHKLLF
jgi:glutaredoxin-related protein